MIELPLKVESGNVAHAGQHWAVRAKKSKLHRSVAFYGMKNALPKGITLPCVVRLIRIAPRLLDKDENLPFGFKSIKDGIADWLGINDNDPRVKWEYAQHPGKPKQYSVGVEIQPELPL